jgi:thiol-disulfide isomerase/thioredoxin
MFSFLKKLSLLLLLLATTNIQAQNRSINFDHESDWKTLLEKAKKENKLIFVDCYTTWCGPCKWMAKNVFTNDTVADFFNAKFINAKIDMEKGEGKDIAVKYGIQAYPTFIFVNGDGEQVHRVCGSNEASYFLADAHNALDPEKQVATLTRKFEGNKSNAAVATTYLDALRKGCQETNSALNTYFNTQKESELTSRSNWTIIYRYVKDYSSPAFLYLEKNKEAYSALYTKDSVEDKLNGIYFQGLMTAVNKDDKKGIEELKKKVAASGIKDADRTIMQADLVYFQKHKDWDKYTATTSTFIEKYGMQNAGLLNNTAWFYYENIDDKTQLEKATRWAKLACDQENTYSNNDTYAALLYKLKKKDEAKLVAEKAIEMAKKEGTDYAETEKLLAKINELK